MQGRKLFKGGNYSRKYGTRRVYQDYEIPNYSFRGNYSFLNLEIQRLLTTVHKAKGHST